VASHAKRVLELYSSVGYRRVVDRVGYVMPAHRRELADPDGAHVRTSCAYCGASVTGELRAGRNWFAEHRERGCPPVAPVPVSPPG
jgi:hypothetical protein